MGGMSVDILGVGAGPHCWYSIGGRVIGRFSSISMGKKRKYSSKIYRPRQPADAGPGGLKK